MDYSRPCQSPGLAWESHRRAIKPPLPPASGQPRIETCMYFVLVLFTAISSKTELDTQGRLQFTVKQSIKGPLISTLVTNQSRSFLPLPHHTFSSRLKPIPWFRSHCCMDESWSHSRCTWFYSCRSLQDCQLCVPELHQRQLPHNGHFQPAGSIQREPEND